MKVLAPLLFALSAHNYASQKADSFVVESHGKYIKVIAPEAYSDQSALVVENKMLANIYARVETTMGRLIGYVSIVSKGSKVVALDLKRGESGIFIPLSPPFQEAELTFGRESYEIPPQK